MIELVKRKVLRVQISEITLKRLCDFYDNEDNREVILLLYDKDIYFSNIGFEEILKFIDETDLFYFLSLSSVDKTIVESDGELSETARKSFDNNADIRYILIKDSNTCETAFFYTDIVFEYDVYIENLMSVKNKLRRESVNTYFVKIPAINDMGIKDKDVHRI